MQNTTDIKTNRVGAGILGWLNPLNKLQLKHQLTLTYLRFRSEWLTSLSGIAV